MKVLFCTDGSKTSFNALENFSKWHRAASVDIICVIDWSFLPDEVYIEESGFANSCANVACSIIEKAKNEITELGMNLDEAYRVCGSASDSIAEQLDSKNYDLVLMGSHGKKGQQRWLGSVSREIIINTQTSGYVSKENNNAQKILFTTDGSEQALHAIKKTINSFNFENKEIHLCTVNEDPDLLFLEGSLDANWLLEIQKRQKMFALKTLKEAELLIQESGLTIAGKSVLSGQPAQAIIDYSSKENIDLIVLGGRLKAKHTFLRNSVNERILENTKSDVMIIKSQSENIE